LYSSNSSSVFSVLVQIFLLSVLERDERLLGIAGPYIDEAEDKFVGSISSILESELSDSSLS